MGSDDIMNIFKPGISDDGELARLRARNAALEAECRRLERVLNADTGASTGWLDDDSDDHDAEHPRTGRYVWDEIAGRCLYFSPEIPVLLGALTDSGDEADFLRRLDEADRKRYSAALDGLRTAGRRLSMDYIVRGPDGKRRHVRETRDAIFDDNGTLVQTVGSVEDISQENLLREKLNLCRERFRHYASGSSHYLWEMDASLKFTFVSEGIRHVTGEDPSDFIGRTRRDIAGTVPIDPEALATNLTQMARRESFSDYLIERPRTTGGTVHLRLSGKPIYHPDGTFVGYRGTAQDVTEWNETLCSLCEGEEKYRNLVEGSIQGMLISRDWKPLFANQACADIFGFSSVGEFLEHGSLENLVLPEHRDQLRNSRDARMRGEEISERVLAHCIRRDGKTIVLESINRLIEWDGQLAIQTTIFDITERKMNEERLQQTRDELETTVLKRTTELRQANRLLKEEIKERKQAEIELQRNQSRLSDAIESISDGFVLFDPNEQLVMCNSRYRELHPGIADKLVNGAQLEDVLRAIADRGLHLDGKRHGEEWVQRRLAEYRAAPEMRRERQLPDGTWVHGTVRKTSQGGIVGTRTDITERKNWELALQLSEDRLRQAAEVAGLGYCIWDSVEDQCIYCSEEYARIHGTDVEGYLKRAQPAGGNCPFTHPEDEEAYQRAIEVLRRDGTGFGLEYRMILESGDVRHVRIYVKPVLDELGQVVQEYLTMQDITEQKLTEIALRNNQDLLTAIIDHAPAAIDVKDEQSRFVLVNRQVEALFSAKRKDIEGKRSADFLPPEIAEQCETGDRYVLETGRDLADERTVNFNGAEQTFYTIKFKIPQLPGGSGAGIGRIITDITELKRREQALRENRELLETIINTAPVRLTVKDAESRYIYVNRNELNVFGLLDSDYVGKQLEELMDPETAAHVRALDREVIDTGKAIPQYEEQLNDAEDRHRHWLSAKAPVIVDGEVRYVVTTSIDVTESKQREAELSQAHKMEAIGRLTSGIAHDFNNLLAVINGNLLFLRRKAELEGDLIRYVDAIETAANLGTGLTRGLISFSRHKDFNSVPVDLAELVEGAKKDLFSTLPATVIVHTEFATETASALTDPQQFQIALFNLVLNARDAMPEGGTVTIATRNVDRSSSIVLGSGGPWVEISVTDSGTGIPANQLDRVFDPLFSTKPPGSGTGLGLSMVKRFVEQSRGLIDIASEPGKGTSVVISLPRADGKPKTDSTRQDIAATGGTETVLVAEDDEAVRRVAVMALKELGYRVLEAENGERALEVLLANDEIALLFSDIELGGPLNGHGLAARARAHDPRLEILLCSGHTAQKPSAGGPGKPPLMRKPYDPDHLAKAIRNALDRRRENGTV